MDWLRQIPMGQYVDGSNGWMRRLDPRLKLAWSLLFLLTPVLGRAHLAVGSGAGASAADSGQWFAVSSLVAFPCGSDAAGGGRRHPVHAAPHGGSPCRSGSAAADELPGAAAEGPAWDLVRLGPWQIGSFDLGPLVIDRASALLGLRTSTLIFTVIHSVNLVLITTTPEDLVWALSWCLSPLQRLGLPMDRLGFQLLLALWFLPLVQEELQNLLRSLISRAVSLRRLGFKAAFGLVLAVGERLLANILLRAEQGAEALVARGGRVMGPRCSACNAIRRPAG